MAFKFEKLQVWRRALELTVDIDKLIKKFPPEEKYALASQIKRAADSIVLNNKEFSRFMDISLRSSIEVVTCLHLGGKRNLIHEPGFSTLYSELDEIIKMIQGLRNSLK